MESNQRCSFHMNGAAKPSLQACWFFFTTPLKDPGKHRLDAWPDSQPIGLEIEFARFKHCALSHSASLHLGV